MPCSAAPRILPGSVLFLVAPSASRRKLAKPAAFDRLLLEGQTAPGKSRKNQERSS